jgi:hypothetical protein
LICPVIASPATPGVAIHRAIGWIASSIALLAMTSQEKPRLLLAAG